jgi:hypothetical protein
VLINKRLSDKIFQVVPFKFPPRLNGEVYANFRNDELPDLLDDVPLQFLAHLWFQHDGASVHYRRYPDSWIGRGGPIHWPARSPDLTPLDYFLWGHVKNYVYREPVNSLEQLDDRLHEALATITPQVIQGAQASLIRRARLCIQIGGGHFEQLL